MKRLLSPPLFSAPQAFTVLATVCLFAASPICAQSLEDKLRDQLRSTLNELHELQDQQASLQAAKAAAEQERDALKVQLAKAQAQAAHPGEIAAAKAQAQSLESEVTKYKQAADEASGTAQTAQADRDKLQTTLADAQKQLGRCEEKNTKLLKVGNEILDAYQQFDVGDAIGANEPFIGIKRVELENTAQDFDDRLHQGKFDPNAKQPAASPGTGQQPASVNGGQQPPPPTGVQQPPPGSGTQNPPRAGSNGK